MGELNASTGDSSVLRKAWIAALVWAAIAMAIRIAWLAYEPPIAFWDGAIYARTAVRIAHGMGFVDTWNNLPPYKPTAFYPVGYPATLGAGYFLFGVHAWVAGAINVLAAGVSALVAVRLSRSAFGAVPGHVTGAFYAFSPGAVFYTSAFMTEPLSAAVLCLAIVAMLHHARTGRAWSALIAGALLGFGGLVRPPALMVAPVLALALPPQRRWIAQLRTLALVGVACCAVVLPWTARNCRELDGCALVSLNGGSNLFIGTDPAANGGYRPLRVGEGCDTVLGEVAKDRCYGRLAMARIRAQPFRWLALAPVKVRQLLAQETNPLSYLHAATGGRAFAGRDYWYGIMGAYHSIVLALAILALIPLRETRDRVRRISPEVIAIVAAVATLIAVHIVFFGADRYHFVFTPLLCALAGGAFRLRARSASA